MFVTDREGQGGFEYNQMAVWLAFSAKPAPTGFMAV
jgi:hypothetical protein